MGSTAAYKRIRLCTHLFSLLIIICSLYLIGIYIFYSSFFTVEKDLNMGLLDMKKCYQWTIVMNIIMALFGSCAINSKVKYFMKVYIILGFFGLSILLVYFMFIFGFYKTTFSNYLSINWRNNNSVRVIMISMWECREFGENNCIEYGKKMVNALQFWYFIVWVLCFIMDFVLYTLTYAAMIININEPKARPPRINQNVHVGFDSASLRRRRFIDGEIEIRTSELRQGVN